MNTVVSGRRYYSPSQGRFLGRDPKEEAGGLNLYGFCRNNPINLWDRLGMDPPDYDGGETDETATTETNLGNGRVLVETWRWNANQATWVKTGSSTRYDPSASAGALPSIDDGDPIDNGFHATARPSVFGNGTLLRPGMNTTLDAWLSNPNFVAQLGVLYALTQAYGKTTDAQGNVVLTEFFATLNLDSPTSRTLYSNSITLSPADYAAGGWTASVQPTMPAAGTTDAVALVHTHMVSGPPSDGHDFAFGLNALNNTNLWSIIVTPDKIYFTAPNSSPHPYSVQVTPSGSTITGPDSGRYYYLPVSAFTSAGSASNTTIQIPPVMPPAGPTPGT